MAFKNTKVVCQQAKGITKKISVSIIEDGKKYTVWNNFKADTNKNVEFIVSSIK